jgi:hypothetical protein
MCRMTDRPVNDAASARPLRIVEIGGHPLFAVAVPQQTQFLWAGTKSNPSGVAVLGPFALIQTLLRLRRGDFDLLVIATSQYAPWHPRSFLAVMRDWNIRGPLGLFATFAIRLVRRFHDVPIVAIDLSDSCLIGRHEFGLWRACRAFFKRELPSDHWLVFCRSGYPNFPGRRWRSRKRHAAMVQKLKPISFGAPSVTYGQLPLPDETPSPDKVADIFFAGAVHANSSVRVAGLAELRELAQNGYVIDMPTDRLSAPEYFKRMAAAWLAWSPGGLGWDCGRHYEAPVVGSVPLMNSPTIMRDAPLLDGEHCVFYSPEPGGLVQAARRALADKARLRAMAESAVLHVAKHHTSRARAERVAIAVLGRNLEGVKSAGD